VSTKGRGILSRALSVSGAITDAVYGKQIMEWVDSNYSMVEELASEPPTKKPFEIKILKRSSP